MTTPLIGPICPRHQYLRVSVTDRCDFAVFYCMSENMTFLPKKDLLTLEELDRMFGVYSFGVQKLRITGGETTWYADIMIALFPRNDPPSIGKRRIA
jgi:cyclic pyranopterin phosphate synthase